MYETIQSLTKQQSDLEARVNEYHEQIKDIEDFKNEISDKNKTIKMLNQRLADMKKTLQNELKSTAIEKNGAPVSNGNANTNKMVAVNNGHNESETDQLVNNQSKSATAVAMDDVNLKYLKHVILKFLTSREVGILQLYDYELCH